MPLTAAQEAQLLKGLVGQVLGLVDDDEIKLPLDQAQGVLAPLAREVRRHVDVPVSVSGRITDPSVAQHLIESGASVVAVPGVAESHSSPASSPA